MSRTERPEQVQAPALRSILRMIDMAIENGSLNPQDRDEVIQMFISGPTTVVDSKAGGGMMNINEMIRPIGMAAGGPIPPEPKKPGIIEKIKDFFKYENESGTGSLLMDFISNQGMFAPSRKGFDTSDSPMIKSESRTHPLVVFKEMYDQYRIDGGEMSFKEFFDMIQTNLNNEAST